MLSFDTPRAPRLSVGHLLVWLVCCSIYLAVLRQLATQTPSLVGLLLIVIATIIDGTAWAGLVVFVSRRIRGVRWPIEPGEWLLAIIGARLLTFVLLETWLAWTFTSRTSVLSAFTCFLLVVPTLSRKLPMLWKVFFVLAVLIYLGPLLNACLTAWFQRQIGFLDETTRILQLARSWLIAALVVVFGFLDLRQGHVRNWLHWLGLADCLATVISSCCRTFSEI